MTHQYSVLRAFASELEHAMSKDEHSDPLEFVDAVLVLEDLRDTIALFLETQVYA